MVLHTTFGETHRAMIITGFLTPYLLCMGLAFPGGPAEQLPSVAGAPGVNVHRLIRSVPVPKDLAAVDLVQHTCALYVAMRSHALRDPIAFGRELESAAVRWNYCPGGTMVACAVVPTADGDSVVTGIPLH